MIYTDLRDDCLLQYKMNDVLETQQVLDTSGNANHGIADQQTINLHEDSGDPPYLNGCLSHNGVNDHIEFDSEVNLTGVWAVGLWIWVDYIGGMPMVLLGNTVGGLGVNYIRIVNSAGDVVSIKFVNDVGATCTWSSLPIVYHTWRWVTFNSVSGGQFLHLYIDNVFKGSKTLTTDFDLNLVGGGAAGGASWNFKGRMDCLDIFDKVLSEDNRDFLWDDEDGTELLVYSAEGLAVDDVTVSPALTGEVTTSPALIGKVVTHE